MVNLMIMDTSFQVFAIIDQYESLVWADRYWAYGDFELVMMCSDSALEILQQDYYIRITQSKKIMIIESILIETDAEDGDKLTVTGRSLESILDRRIIWGKKTVFGNIQTAIIKLLTENFISPSNSSRKISNFTYTTSTDSTITSLYTEAAQYTGDVIGDVIADLCQDNEIGFQITLDDDYNFVFSLYAGADRSYTQVLNPYIVFSPSFDNLINSSFLESHASWKNVTLVMGEEQEYTDDDDNTYTYTPYATIGSASGLRRRELFTDASDISKTDDDDNEIDDTYYAYLLQQRGLEELLDTIEIETLEGELDASIQYVYGEDFWIGDVVQAYDGYGHLGQARITEVIISDDESGYSLVPTFEAIDLDDDDDD